MPSNAGPLSAPTGAHHFGARLPVAAAPAAPSNMKPAGSPASAEPQDHRSNVMPLNPGQHAQMQASESQPLKLDIVGSSPTSARGPDMLQHARCMTVAMTQQAHQLTQHVMTTQPGSQLAQRAQNMGFSASFLTGQPAAGRGDEAGSFVFDDGAPVSSAILGNADSDSSPVGLGRVLQPSGRALDQAYVGPPSKEGSSLLSEPMQQGSSQ